MLESFTITLRAKSPARPAIPPPAPVRPLLSSFLTTRSCPLQQSRSPPHPREASPVVPLLAILSGRQEHPHYLVLPHSPRKMAEKVAGKSVRSVASTVNPRWLLRPARNPPTSSLGSPVDRFCPIRFGSGRTARRNRPREAIKSAPLCSHDTHTALFAGQALHAIVHFFTRRFRVINNRFGIEIARASNVPAGTTAGRGCTPSLP